MMATVDRRITIVNPLSGALAHYVKELKHTLEAAGGVVAVIAVEEPSVAGGSKVAWLLRYASALVAARKNTGPVIVTWPVLGYIDLLLLRALLGSRGHLVMHDPQPLVAARGYGRIWQALGAMSLRSALIVHSEQAQSALDNPRIRERSRLVAHPMLPPDAPSPISDGQGPIRVLGQYKPDRDITALERIAQSVSGTSLEIVGRRWPDVSGWAVRAAFVPESELDALLRGSAAVVIPYKRFYQSGIAIRCLEVGTPVVGPAGTSMEALLGAESRLLAHDDWTTAVYHAMTIEGKRDTETAAVAWYTRAVEEWAGWMHHARR